LGPIQGKILKSFEKQPSPAFRKTMMSPLESIKNLLAQAPKPGQAFVGFDGFVDTLYHVIKRREGAVKIPYADIPEFAAEVASRAGKSAGLEVERISVRAGGNAPLMAQGLTALGVPTACAGAMGAPSLHPAFDPLARSGCELLSIADAASTVAMEFDDGKLMLNDTLPLEQLDWIQLSKCAVFPKVRELALKASLLALVDWVNMPHATALWRGLFEEVLEKAPTVPNRQIFFDLADLGRSGAKEILELLLVLARYRKLGRVSLGLNENEALKLAEKLGLAGAGLEVLGFELLKAAQVDCVVIHPRDRAYVFEGASCHQIPGRVVAKPLLSTGGGDHFNAGFCFGLLQGLAPKDAAELAVRVSGLYVEKGKSPSRAELLACLDESPKV
jgi:hypothetical protein